MAIYNREKECQSRQEREIYQGKALSAMVEKVYNNVPFYKKKLDEVGVKPSDIKTVADLKKLPFTIKQDLRDNYPFGLIAVPKTDIVRLHASSGTTGKPTVVAYTKNDIELWSEVMARSFASAGGSSESTVHIAYGYGLFTGGLGAHYGAEKIGATTVPMSSGNTKKQIMLMKDFEADILCCTPSYAIYLAEEMVKAGIDPKKDINLKAGIFGAEPWSNEIKANIEERFGIKAMDIYGLSEIIGPGVSIECEFSEGAHIQEDHFLPEIINPETLEPVEPGEVGELVFTTITKEGMPLIRYRTRDITSLNYEKCKCGRTTVRMGKVAGRTDDMLIIRGVNVYPSQIESVIMELSEIEPHYQLIITRDGTLDEMEVHVEMSETLFSDEVKKIQTVKMKLQENLNSILGIKAKVKIVEPGSIPRSEGKSKRVIDLRGKV